MEELLGNVLTPANIIQGGGVLIALVCLGIIYKLVTNHHAHSDQIIQENTKAHTIAAERSTQQAEAISKLADVLDRKL